MSGCQHTSPHQSSLADRLWQDAPGDVRAIAAGLKVLLSVLNEILGETKQPCSLVMEGVLSECIIMAQELLDMIHIFEKGFGSAKSRIRTWKAIKFAFRNDQVKKSQQLLESMKSTLLLAQQKHYG